MVSILVKGEVSHEDIAAAGYVRGDKLRDVIGILEAIRRQVSEGRHDIQTPEQLAEEAIGLLHETLRGAPKNLTEADRRYIEWQLEQARKDDRCEP